MTREYVFYVFRNPKTRLFTFFEVSCQKNVNKNVESIIQVFTLLHSKMLTITQSPCSSGQACMLLLLRFYVFKNPKT